MNKSTKSCTLADYDDALEELDGDLYYEQILSKYGISKIDKIIHYYAKTRIEIPTDILTCIPIYNLMEDGAYNFIKSLVDLNYKITYNDFVYVCQTMKYDLIKKLSSPDFVLNNKIIKNLFECLNDYSSCVCMHIDDIVSIIDLFIEYKYVLTIEDLDLITSYMCYVNNIEDLGINIAQILELQTKYEYFPYFVKDGKLVGTKIYAYIKGGANITAIKNITNDKQFIFNKKCLKLACSSFKYFKDIERLAKNYKIDIDNDIILEYTMGIIKKTQKSKHIIEYYYDKNPKVFSHTIQIGDLYDNSNNQQNGITNNIKIVLDNIVVPKIRSNVSITDDVFNVFKLDKRQISFIALRKKIIDYIKKNKLLVNNVIVIDGILAKLCNLNEKNVVDLADMDKLVSYCIIYPNNYK